MNFILSPLQSYSIQVRAIARVPGLAICSFGVLYLVTNFSFLHLMLVGEGGGMNSFRVF